MPHLSCPAKRQGLPAAEEGAASWAERLNPDLHRTQSRAEIEGWLAHLGDERRYSPKTLEAYRRDVLQFLAFLAEHLGGPPSLKELAELTPADVRAFMAARRAADIGSRSLMRSLAGVRGFARYLERNGKGKVGALGAVRAPKIGKTLPRPLAASAAKRLADADLAAGDDREPWIHARDAAVLALLYGSGLRISEALGLTRDDFGARARDAITVTGKGRKQRMVPVLPQVAKADRRLSRALSVRPAARRPAVCRRQGRAAVAARRAAGDGAAARRAWPARDGDPARAAAFLRHPPPRPRRRSARDPGTARTCLAGDDADLHRSRRRRD